MPEGQLQHPWPDPPPGPKGPRGTRVWTVLRALRAGGWLRPRRIGCLLVVLVILVFAALWAVGSAVNGVTAMFRNDPGPITGNPLTSVTPTNPPSTGAPGPKLGLGGKLIVAIQDAPGLAKAVPGQGNYAGFGIALLDLITRDLTLDPGATNYKSAPTTSFALGMVNRGEANLALGEFAVPPQQGSQVAVVVPYLESPLRLAVPSNSPVTGWDSLGQGKVCAPRDSPTATALTMPGLLGNRLLTRTSLRDCENLLGKGVAAIVANEIALRGLPATVQGTLRMVGEPLGSTEYGIAIAPDDDVLGDRVNTVLRKAINDGTWARLYAEYLGTPVPDPPTIR